MKTTHFIWNIIITLILATLSAGFFFIFGGRMIARMKLKILRKMMFEK